MLDPGVLFGRPSGSVHAEDVAVYSPGQPDPRGGRHDHDLAAVEFFKTFPDNHRVNNPYKIFSVRATTPAPWQISQAR